MVEIHKWHGKMPSFAEFVNESLINEGMESVEETSEIKDEEVPDPKPEEEEPEGDYEVSGPKPEAEEKEPAEEADMEQK